MMRETGIIYFRKGQGVRNADTRVGERVAVIGLGLIGQLTAQILKASGCQVFGIDVAEDKIKLAKDDVIEETIDEVLSKSSDSFDKEAMANVILKKVA